MLGVSFGFTSAFAWGSADLAGGFATRRSDQFLVVALASLSGIVLLVALAVATGEPTPSLRSSLWAVAAGIATTLGLAALYRALSLGNVATVAPTASVVGAVLPVLFAAFTEGLPSITQLAGFVLALLGIRLVTQSQTESSDVSRRGLVLAVMAGICFGCFFILIAQVEEGTVFTPLIVMRSAGFCLALLVLLFRGVGAPQMRHTLMPFFSGVLDAGGTVFYLQAERFTRLDVATVLASLYPAATVLLAYTLLKESVSRTQWLGVALCLGAVALIAV